MKNKYVDLEVLKYMITQLSTKISSVFRKIKDSYTKTEIDNKFNDLAKGMNWKESVDTISDLPTTDNTENDARVVSDTSTIYIWNGTGWVNVGSSANIPMASETVSGQMSSADYTKLKSIDETKLVEADDLNDYVLKENGKSLVDDTLIENIHNHNNKDELDKISEDSDGNLTYGGKSISGKIDVDKTLSTTSENPVQNKIVANGLDKKVDKTTVGDLTTLTTTENASIVGAINEINAETNVVEQEEW